MNRLLVNMLNHSNENIRFVARNSQELDMKKRGVVRSRTENNFLGYAVKENGLLDTNKKGGFGVKSDWSHLNHLTQKVDAKIQGEFSEQQEMHKSSSLLIQLQKLSLEKQLEKKSWKVNSLQIPTN